MQTGGNKWTPHKPPWSTSLLSPSWCLTLHHVELDEPPSKDSHRPDDAHGHEDAEQDVVQNHGNEFPLLRRLQADEAYRLILSEWKPALKALGLRKPHIIRFLICFHGLGDVLHPLDGAADVRVFDNRRLVGDTGGGGITCGGGQSLISFL